MRHRTSGLVTEAVKDNPYPKRYRVYGYDFTSSFPHDGTDRHLCRHQGYQENAGSCRSYHGDNDAQALCQEPKLRGREHGGGGGEYVRRFRMMRFHKGLTYKNLNFSMIFGEIRWNSHKARKITAFYGFSVDHLTKSYTNRKLAILYSRKILKNGRFLPFILPLLDSGGYRKRKMQD